MDIQRDSYNHFIGKNGFKRLNCAQTIAMLFKERFDFITNDTIRDFKKMGHGRAPDGECGMLFAAKYILEKDGFHEEVDEIDRFFRGIAGTTNCKVLRKMKIPFCAECLVKTAEYIYDFYCRKEQEIA